MRNGNYRPDCDLLNAAVQDNRASGGDLCGQGDPNYGRNRATTTLDSSVLAGVEGPAQRLADWRVGAAGDPPARLGRSGVLPPVVAHLRRRGRDRQHRRQRRGVRAVRRHRSQRSTAARMAADTASTSCTTSRRPRQRGRPRTSATRPTTSASYDRYWDGFDITFQARLAERPERAGRHQLRPAGRGLLRDAGPPCRSSRRSASPLNPYCSQREPLLTTYKANASYLVPKVDVQVSGTFSSRPGAVAAGAGHLPAERPDDRRDAGPPARGHGQRYRERHRSVLDVRRPDRPGGHARGQAPAVRTDRGRT